MKLDVQLTANTYRSISELRSKANLIVLIGKLADGERDVFPVKRADRSRARGKILQTVRRGFF